MNKVIAQRISAGTFFKLLLIGILFIHLVTCVIGAALIFMGVFSEGSNVAGITFTLGYLVVYFILGVFLMPLWAAFFWLCIYPGIWIYSLMYPVGICYKGIESEET